MVVDTLRLYNMFLHQLTPNSIARLNLYFLLAKTCRFQPSAEDFAFIHRVHYHPKVITVMTAAEAQYGCYNFTYKEIVCSPVTTYKNKWPSDWTSFWFYHKVPLDEATQSHPLITNKIQN